MSSPTPDDKKQRPTGGRPDDLSVNRRGFFREILSLGLERVDQAGKSIGKRFGDVVENKRENIAPPQPDLPKRRPPGNTQARGK